MSGRSSSTYPTVTWDRPPHGAMRSAEADCRGLAGGVGGWGCGAEGDPQAGQVDRPPGLLRDMVDQRAHHLEGSKDLPANLFGRTHGIHRHQDASLGVPGDDGTGYLVVHLQSSADDRLGVVGATLQRGPGKQPTHELTVLDLQVQRHIGGHPQLLGDQVGRAGLLHVARDTV